MFWFKPPPIPEDLLFAIPIPCTIAECCALTPGCLLGRSFVRNYVCCHHVNLINSFPVTFFNNCLKWAWTRI